MPDSDPRDGFFYLLLTPMIDPYISHTLICPVLKIKIENFHVFIIGCHLTIKVDVTEHNDVTKCHGIVIQYGGCLQSK